MYYQKFINFLKEHHLFNEEIFDYWNQNKILFDYLDDEKRIFIGCYYQYEHNYLTKISLIVPFLDDDKTTLINIHEYVHLFSLYHKIGKKCKIDDSCEVLPFLFERIYIRENQSKELLEYYDFLNRSIINDNKKPYVMALNLSDDLLNEYNNEKVCKLDRKVKKLVKKYSKNT